MMMMMMMKSNVPGRSKLEKKISWQRVKLCTAIFCSLQTLKPRTFDSSVFSAKAGLISASVRLVPNRRVPELAKRKVALNTLEKHTPDNRPGKGVCALDNVATTKIERQRLYKHRDRTPG